MYGSNVKTASSPLAIAKRASEVNWANQERAQEVTKFLRALSSKTKSGTSENKARKPFPKQVTRKTSSR
jgi:hypothetical protein